MDRLTVSRRDFLGSFAVASAVVSSAAVASAAAGIKTSDLPDLTIKEVKVFVVKDYSHVVSVVAATGIEGNYTIRNFESDLTITEWLETARGLLVGKNALDRPSFTSRWAPKERILHGTAPNTSSIDICLWDLVGKAVGLPVYQILGACRHCLQAYASSKHLNTVEEFVDSVLKAKAEGFKAYKIHPPYVPPRSSSYIKGKKDRRGCDYRLDMKICRAIREAVGEDFMLILDRVGVYTRQEALTVGRLLDELKFIGYEDPIPSSDIDGLVELARQLDFQLHIGEYVNDMYDFAEYIRRQALGVVRFSLPNIGGITEGMKLASLAECFGMECAPHNQGDTMEQASHFHCELAMPNSFLFEMPFPQGFLEPPYMKDRIRITTDGYVEAPSKPGLGYEIDRDALDNMTVRVAR